MEDLLHEAMRDVIRIQNEERKQKAGSRPQLISLKVRQATKFEIYGIHPAKDALRGWDEIVEWLREIRRNHNLDKRTVAGWHRRNGLPIRWLGKFPQLSKVEYFKWENELPHKKRCS